MNKHDSDTSDSDTSSGSAAKRIQKVMEEIFKHGNKANTKEEIEKMADHCTNMLTKMNTSTDKSKKVTKSSDNHLGRMSGGGDFASPKDERKSNTRAQGKSPQDEFMAKLMGGPSLRDMMMRKKKERPNVGEIYKEKLAERMKNKQFTPGKSADQEKWRGNMGSKSSESGISSEESDDGSPEGRKLPASSGQAKKQSDLGKKGARQNRTVMNEFEAAKKKAQDWLKTQGAGLAKDGKARLQLEQLSSGSDMDSFPSKLNLMKKNEELIKSKIAGMSSPKAAAQPNKPPPSTSTSKASASTTKKQAPNIRTTPSTKKTIKK